MAKAAAYKAIVKAVAKKRGKPKVDKRKTKAKRKAQSTARQTKFRESEAKKAEAQGTTVSARSQERAIERKAKTIRGKDIDASTKNAAIRILEDSKGKLTADQAIKKAKSQSEARMPKVKSRARSETAKLRAKGAFKGFTEEQMKERRNLIASSLREMESKGNRQPIKSRVLSLNPEGEKLIKQKGGIDKILEKPRRYLYQTTDAADPPEGIMDRFGGKTKAEKKKNMKEAFNEMSKSDKLDFIRKNIAPDYSKEQLSNLMFPARGGIQVKGKSRTQIEGLRNRLKDKGLLPALGETRKGTGTKQGKALVKEIRGIKKEAQNIREKDIPKVQTQIDRAEDAMKRAKTTEVKNELRDKISKLKKEKTRLTNLASNVEKGKVTKAKKRLSKMPPQTGSIQSTYTAKKAGGKVGTKKTNPRGCGAALRGYGKAMKGKR